MFIIYNKLFLISGCVLMTSSFATFLIKRNLILLLICIELILISVQLNNIITSYNFDDITGQIFNLFILMVAAAEIAIGLAFLITNYKLRGTIETKFIYLAKG